ncbi:Rne/Rng family ribonuclease [Evansella tamaricis]|uniref:Rne/Rng family ribonuclease n=1 Tax=Evansella tamaricis TaxID=2069301 RepID=A0ABS6J9C0_9BACI|nr:Rne/Rng family ribonuclease [Evansella tamaricis]MBU9710286.1 Rne/Rng family ribonuclease [Evansella tamaricis]
MRKVIINTLSDDKRAAVLEDGNVVEWLLEDEDDISRSGNIILGKVTDIIRGMDAAFVDIGTEKNGFLYKKELVAFQPFKETEQSQNNVPAINSLITKGQSILVQITKEATGTKGARLTEMITLPGEFMVYMPYANYVAVSKKMSSDLIRENWRERAKKWLTNEEGIIIRTVAENLEESEVYNEFLRLRAQYAEMIKAANGKNSPVSPTVLYDQSSILYRVVRDFLSDGESEAVVDNRKDYQSLIYLTGEKNQDLIQLYQGKENIFHAYNLEKHFEKSLKRQVWLKNGGFLIIDRTEAMTVIDVNTGKYTGKESLQDTVLKTNMEAAYMVAEQLRLRDIGGIILIDFIDMKEEEHQSIILSTLKKALKQDRILTNVGGFTNFGLLEMTRKKTRKPFDEVVLEPCKVCSGSGRVPNRRLVIGSLKRDLQAVKFSEDEAMLLDVSETLALELLKKNSHHGMTELSKLERELEKTIYVLPTLNDLGAVNQHAIRMMGSKAEIKEIWMRRMTNSNASE